MKEHEGESKDFETKSIMENLMAILQALICILNIFELEDAKNKHE